MPTSADLYADLASAHMRAGELIDAQFALDTARKLDPRHAETARHRPYLACLKSRTLDARGYVDLENKRTAAFTPLAVGPSADELVRRYPGCGMTWVARAAERRLTGDFQGVLLDFSEAAARMPDDPNASIPYGLALLNAGKPTEARKWLQTAVRERPWDSCLVMREAEAAIAEGKADEARVLLEGAWRKTQHNGRIAVALSEVLDDRNQAFELLLEAIESIPYDDDLVQRARVIGISLDRETEVDAVIAPRISLREIPRPGPEPEEIAVSEEITVLGQSEGDRLREILDEQLQKYGYGPGVVRRDATHYAANNGHPALVVHHDGLLDIQMSGFLPQPIEYDATTRPTVSGRIPLLNKRKMGARRQAVLDAMRPHIQAWRQALGTEKTLERVMATLTDRLDALWYDGVPMDGDQRLLTHEERRRALLDFWASRTCGEAGTEVRRVLQAYLTYEVNASDYPVTEAERAAAIAQSLCDADLTIEAP